MRTCSPPTVTNPAHAASPGSLATAACRCSSVLWRLEARLKGAEFQGTARFCGRPLLSLAAGSRMVFGDQARVLSSKNRNPLGFFQPSVLRTWLPGAKLLLGPRVRLHGAVLCAAVSIEVGEGTVVEWGAMVLDTDFHWPVGDLDWRDEDGSRARPVRIGRGVLIGARAVVMKGVTIGDRALIRPGAVVTKDVLGGHEVAGNPARGTTLA